MGPFTLAPGLSATDAGNSLNMAMTLLAVFGSSGWDLMLVRSGLEKTGVSWGRPWMLDQPLANSDRSTNAEFFANLSELEGSSRLSCSWIAGSAVL